MPTYDYRCEGCGHTFDEFQSMSSALLTDCPECKEPKLRRLIGSGAGIIFKGSGFYETDYKRARKPGDSGSEDSKSGDSKSEKSSSSDSSSDSKPAPAPSSSDSGGAAGGG